MAKRSLAGQVAILTGASGGIGHALARDLSQEGVRVALAARNVSQLEEIAAEIMARGGDAMVVPVDVTDDVQTEALVQRVIEMWGRVDIVIANAGVYTQTTCADLDPACLRHAMEINYFGAVRTVLAALPHLRRQHSGHIVFMASMAAFIPIPGDAPYVASKAALSGLAQVMRQELAADGIAVMTVYPGRIDTPMIEHVRVPWISPKASPDKLAKKVISGLQRQRRRIIYPFTGYMYLIRELFPALGDWLIRALRLQGLPEKSRKADQSH